MGYLITHAGDAPHFGLEGMNLDTYEVMREIDGEAPKADLSLMAHAKLIEAARSGPHGFPLIRRMTDYYANVFFESDEPPALLQELHALTNPTFLEAYVPLVEICRSAIERGVGLEAHTD